MTPSLATVERDLQTIPDLLIRHGELLAQHTSYGLGGPARLWIEPSGIPQLCLAMVALGDAPWIVLGAGTNVLFPDEGFDGVVICTRRIQGCRVEHHGLCALAGTPLATVIDTAAREGLSGMQDLWGIPGTVGGAVAGNAGTREIATCNLIDQVVLVDSEGRITTKTWDELAIGYRSGGIPARHVVAETRFGLSPGDPARIRRAMDAARQRRAATQPWGQPSAGCVFRNPPHDSAGRLIDQAGLKGTRIGGAVVSGVHANFIVVDGPARSSDVRGLISLIQERVLARHGVRLEPELMIMEAAE